MAINHGSDEAANYDYVIGDGSDIRLLGSYGNAFLDNAKPDANDREFLSSISSANTRARLNSSARPTNYRTTVWTWRSTLAS